MRPINFASTFPKTMLAAAALLGASSGLASATPTLYDITAIYSSGDASGTVTASFIFDPSSDATGCGGSPNDTCYWELDGVGSLSVTGTYSASVGGAGDPANTEFEQTLWSAPNPDYTQEAYLSIGDALTAGLQIALFPAPFTDLATAVVPTGTFTFPDGNGSSGSIGIGGGAESASFTSVTITAETVPEPAPIALLALPLAGLLMLRHRRHMI